MPPRQKRKRPLLIFGIVVIVVVGAVWLGANQRPREFQFVKSMHGKLRYSTGAPAMESLYEFQTPANQVLDAARAEVVPDGWKPGITTPERATFVRAHTETITFLKVTSNMQEGPDTTCFVLVPKYEPPLKVIWHWLKKKF